MDEIKFYLIPVDKDKCELEGPFECPTCAGHMMLDASFLDQVTTELVCPYCRHDVEMEE
jgi:DNA-directed RNA polymerase subunit RPC12/RpoP